MPLLGDSGILECSQRAIAGQPKELALRNDFVTAKSLDPFNMAAPSNIDHFNRVVLVALNQLYDAFPVPTELKIAEIAEAASPGALANEPTFKELEPTFEAIKFLAKEGFLHFTDHWLDGTAFLNVQLTLKGMTVLGHMPDSLDKKTTLISQVKSALQSGVKAASTDAAKQVVSHLFAAAVSAAPVVIEAANK